MISLGSNQYLSAAVACVKTCLAASTDCMMQERFVCRCCCADQLGVSETTDYWLLMLDISCSGLSFVSMHRVGWHYVHMFVSELCQAAQRCVSSNLTGPFILKTKVILKILLCRVSLKLKWFNVVLSCHFKG